MVADHLARQLMCGAVVRAELGTDERVDPGRAGEALVTIGRGDLPLGIEIARAAVSEPEAAAGLLPLAACVAAAYAAADKAHWMDAGWFVERGRRLGEGRRSPAADAVQWELDGLAALVEWQTYAGTAEYEKLSAELSDLRARNSLQAHHAAAMVAVGMVDLRRCAFSDAVAGLSAAVRMADPGSVRTLHAQAELLLAYVRCGQRPEAWAMLDSLGTALRDDDVSQWQALVTACGVLPDAMNLNIPEALEAWESARRAVNEAWTVHADTVIAHARMSILLGTGEWDALAAHVAAIRSTTYRDIYDEHELRAIEADTFWISGAADGYRAVIRGWRAAPGASTSPYFRIHQAQIADLDDEVEAMVRHIEDANGLLAGAEDPLGAVIVRVKTGDLLTKRVSAVSGMEYWESAREDLIRMEAHGMVSMLNVFISLKAQEIVEDSSNPLDALTDQQRTVVEHVAEGFTSAEIAARLHVTRKTVDFHVGNALIRLDVESRREFRPLVERYGVAGR